MKFLLILIGSVSLILQADAARILVYTPMPSISHQVVFRSLTQELVRRGHEVVFITPDPAFPKGKAPANLTEIDVHDISYDTWKKEKKSLVQQNPFDLLEKVRFAFDAVLAVFEHQLMHEDVQKIINGNDTFDLLMTEAIMRPALALKHKFKVPVIQISSFGANFNNYDVYGAPSHPLLYPTTMIQRVYNLTFVERLKEMLKYFLVMRLYNSYEEVENKLLKKYFGEDMTPIGELQNEVDMLFLNVHPIFEGNNPVPPSIIHMWGIHVKPEKELPEDLKTYLDSSKNGVIYMSLGTNVDPANLPPETIQLFIKAFSKLPYDILFKWSKDELPGISDNVKIGKWFPQSDLLRHPKIKLFITQGGLQSTDEAIIAGVPLVGMPIFADQWRNVEKYAHFGIGVKIYRQSLTEEKILNAVNTVINDDSYRKNIKKLSALMHDEPMLAKDRVAFWVDHVIRYGGAKHLRAPAANMSWTKYYELDIVAFLLVILVIIYYVLRYILRLIVRMLKKLFVKEKIE